MPDPSSRFAALIAELRRRRVSRVAVVYACVAFIIFQIIDATFDYMPIPDWVGTAFIVVLLLCFPVAVGMAWAFDLTAEGLVRAKVKREPAAAKAPHHPLVGNKTLAVIAVLAIIAAAWSWWGRPAPAGPIRSIAVLPLENLMGDPDEEYFVDGMHEAIITNLARLSELKVISRTSAMRYKDTDKLVPEIARELNVDALVEGSVLKAGNRVRIAAQLIHGASDEHLWANDYEGDLTDILSLHSDVARAIAGEIGLALKPEEEAYLASAPQVNPEAYNLYLKGWHLRTLMTGENVPKAVEYLEQSVALDSTFALAWVALGESYAMMFISQDWSFDYALGLMKQTIDKALDLDPNLSEAHALLGLHQEVAQYDFTGAEASFKRALELDPDNVNARHEYGLFLNRTGRPDEALEQVRRGQELDPVNQWPYEGFHRVYEYIRQYEKELEFRLLRGEVRGRPLNNSEAERRILMQQGRYAEVAEEAGVNTWEGRRALMALGNVAEVYAFRDSLRSSGELQQREQETPNWSARFYAIMDERDKALSLLERAYEDTITEYMYTISLVYAPEFDSLRAEPRFKALIQKLGLTEVFDQYGRRIR